MRTTQAARYARWSAAVAILLALAVAGVYVRGAWHSRRVRQAAVPVPASVQQQSAQFSLSKVNGEKTQFTIRASRATEFTGGNRNLLEDVWITAYGTDTKRYDNLHTRSCDYIVTTGLITCAGDVQIDLQSSEDPHLHAGDSAPQNRPRDAVHIATSHVSFERETGVATTDQLVEFHLPQGDGTALGVHYDSQKGEMRLLHNVKMMLHPGMATGGGPAAPIGAADVNITASSMTYRRDDRVVHLLGPVAVQQGLSRLNAGNLNVELDEQLRARRIVASEHPKVAGNEHGDPVALAADEISVLLSTEGWTERAIAAGNVRLNGKNAAGENHLSAKRVELEPVAGTNQPRRMTASGDVAVVSDLTQGGSRRMKTSSLVLDFLSGSRTGQATLQHAATPAATIDWESPAAASAKAGGKPALQRMHMASNQLDASFAGANELREVHGVGDVVMQRQLGDAPPVTSASREVLAAFGSGGEWSTVEQTGDVRLRDGRRTAQAERAHFDRAADTAILNGSVTITDDASRTTAQSATFVQNGNEFRADGNVVTSEIAAGNATATASPGSRPSGSNAPAHISADHLTVNTASGAGIYSGRARLWQGDSIVEADRVELDRASQTLTAISHVRAIFPQAPMTPASPPSGGGPPSHAAAAPRQAVASSGPMHAQADRMIYVSAEHSAHLEQHAQVRTDQGTVRSSVMDLFFAPEGAKEPAATASPASTPLTSLGGQSLTRAVAIGNVVIDDGDRHARAGRADYTAGDGKFVLSGDNPTVYDGSGNATKGRQLTFVFADDTIVVDSEVGSRTLTLHRVGK